MNTIKVTVKDRVAIISLDRGKANAINSEMVQELRDFVNHTSKDENISGLILTGKENFFSAGLDLIELYDYNELQTKTFWEDFLFLQQALISYKKPIVAAISGHSPAGGCVLAICADYRVMAEGNYIIGLNEIPVGMIVPESIFDLYAFWLGKRKAYQFLMEGKLLSVDEALQHGLIDEISRQGNVITMAERKIRTYLQHNPPTWWQSKLNLRKKLIHQVSADHSDTLEAIQKQWWSPQSREIIKTVIQNLKK